MGELGDQRTVTSLKSNLKAYRRKERVRLHLIQLCVFPTQCQQFAVLPLLYQTPTLHHPRVHKKQIRIREMHFVLQAYRMRSACFVR